MSDKQQVGLVGGVIGLIFLVLVITSIGPGAGASGTEIKGKGFSFEGGDATPVDEAKIPGLARRIPVAIGLQNSRAAQDGTDLILAGTLTPTGVPAGTAKDPAVAAQLDRYVQGIAKQAGFPEAYGPTYKKIDGRLALGYEFRPEGSTVASASAYYVLGSNNVLYAIYCGNGDAAVAGTACNKAIASAKIS